jgi:predicted nucleic acid-binding protein
MSDRADCLLDSSSLMLLMKKQGDQVVPKLGSFCVLDLTTHEMGNVLWRQRCLKSLTKEEVSSLADTTRQILEMLKRVTVGPEQIGKTLQLAEDEGLTFYDASYLNAAIDKGISLATEDQKLRKAARKHVTVKTASEL